jgi:hypothetical protein
MENESTINPAAPELTYTQPRITRQQRRHAKEALEYQQSVAKQGKRYIKGYSSNPKGPSHIGTKQLAKLRSRQNVPAMEQKPMPVAGQR